MNRAATGLFSHWTRHMLRPDTSLRRSLEKYSVCLVRNALVFFACRAEVAKKGEMFEMTRSSSCCVGLFFLKHRFDLFAAPSKQPEG